MELVQLELNQTKLNLVGSLLWCGWVLRFFFVIMDFDKVLIEVGSFGLYQKIIICGVLLPAGLPCAFHAYSQLFIAATPKHWCRTPQLEPWVQDYTELVMNLSIPIRNQMYSECDMYIRNYSDIVRYLEYRTPLELQRDKVWHIGSPKGSRLTPCQFGWHYDRSQYPSTVVTEVRKYTYKSIPSLCKQQMAHPFSKINSAQNAHNTFTKFHFSCWEKNIDTFRGSILIPNDC